MIELLSSATLAFLTSMAVTYVLIRLGSRVGLMDVPNHRSSHSSPVPKGGGVAVWAAVGLATAAAAVLMHFPDRRIWLIIVTTGAIAAIGLLDDFLHLPVVARLAAQLCIALIVAVLVGAPGRLALPAPLDIPLGWLSIPLTILWLVAVTNFFNFMDGLDGLAGGEAIACAVGVCVAGWSAEGSIFAILIGAATAGFLVFNLPPARIFLGDVGSTSLGFAIGALPLLAPSSRTSSAVFAAAIGLGLFLLDPIETIVRLYRSGSRIGTAHRQHAYQLLATTPRTKVMVTALLVAAGVVLAVGGGLSYRFVALSWPMIGLAIAAYLLERSLALRANPRRFAPRTGR